MIQLAHVQHRSPKSEVARLQVGTFSRCASQLLCHTEDGFAGVVAKIAESESSLLGVGLELGAHLALLKLLGEPLVIAPKQANVWNIKQHHGQTLQTQPGSKHMMKSDSVSYSFLRKQPYLSMTWFVTV